jgi:hypothetical protein
VVATPTTAVGVTDGPVAVVAAAGTGSFSEGTPCTGE